MSANFPTSYDSYSGLINGLDKWLVSLQNNVQDAIEACEAKVGITGSAVSSSYDYKVNQFFVSGRKIWLYENGPAPTGWSLEGSASDCLLAVKGGGDVYNTTGGTTAGSWSHLHNADHSWHTTNTDGYHSHDILISGVAGPTGSSGCYDLTGSGSHGHTVGSWSGDTDANTAYRPGATVGILIVKN